MLKQNKDVCKLEASFVLRLFSIAVALRARGERYIVFKNIAKWIKTINAAGKATAMENSLNAPVSEKPRNPRPIISDSTTSKWC